MICRSDSELIELDVAVHLHTPQAGRPKGLGDCTSLGCKFGTKLLINSNPDEILHPITGMHLNTPAGCINVQKALLLHCREGHIRWMYIELFHIARSKIPKYLS